MKQCIKCKENKSLSDFCKNKRRKDGLNSFCKTCGNALNKINYTKTQGKSQKEFNKNKTINNSKFVLKYLLEHSCVDCNEKDPVVLEFDHVRGVKLFSISSGIRRGKSISDLTKEIAKCEVRCANCHRRITAIRSGYFRLLQGIEGSIPENSTQYQCDDTGKIRTTGW